MTIRFIAYKTLPVLVLLPVATYGYLKYNKYQAYRALEKEQRRIKDSYGAHLTFNSYDQASLPTFKDHIVSVSNFLPQTTFDTLKSVALTHQKTERSYLPGHKQGGTVSYEELHQIAPEIIAFYHSPTLHQLCSDIVGEAVVPTPINDQSSCSLLFYNKPGDHIGWHYDHNFYNGRHFTVLLPLVNEKNDGSGLSSAQLMAQINEAEVPMSSAPNTLIMFEGAKVVHKVTRLGPDETRIILSMTFCTNPTASLVKAASRRVKDTAFYGIRALWT